MNEEQKKIALLLFFLLALSTLFIFNKNDVKGENILPFDVEPNLTIVPELNISRFAPYTIEAGGIPDTPNSVLVEIKGLNGDGSNCWNFYVDGTCNSEIIHKNMTESTNKYISENIYPDDIYPEIYFADSDITWNNSPVETIIRRNDYHIMHFTNPFTMVDDMAFFIEFNVEPVSTVNSADLQVYLVEKGNNIQFFNEDWINNSEKRVELVGTFSKNSPVHHIHTENSNHRLVQLSTNHNGTVGPKELNISEEFWVVLYSNSPNNNRGWRLRYHQEHLCNNTNQWYRADQRGWTTTFQAGCPDSHIHIARRNINYMDGVEIILRAQYDTYTLQSELNTFYFGELPNLPPASTSFISPTVGGSYNGEISIAWNPATDPNNDPLTYNIYLTKEGGATVELVNGTANTTIPLNTTSYEDGNYTLTGEICDGINPCVDFYLGGNFSISNDSDIQSITSTTLYSSNTNNSLARIGDTVTLYFETSGPIQTPETEIFSGGDNITNITSNNLSNLWEYSFEVDENITSGDITFTISSTSLDKEYSDTTDSSFVKVDTTPIEYTITYETTEGGTILGNSNQTVTQGSDATEVIATPNEGYSFTGWSDGLLTENRTDTNVTENIIVTANFIQTTYHIDEEDEKIAEEESEDTTNETEAEEVQATEEEVIQEEGIEGFLAKTGFGINILYLVSLFAFLTLIVFKKRRNLVKI